MRRALLLLIGAAFFCLGAGVAKAEPGKVVLVSDTWDNVCHVQVMSGLNAPQQGPVESFDNVQRGRKITKDDKLCYRRSGNPSDCSSGWTDWRCDSELSDDKTSTFSLS